MKSEQAMRWRQRRLTPAYCHRQHGHLGVCHVEKKSTHENITLGVSFLPSQPSNARNIVPAFQHKQAPCQFASVTITNMRHSFMKATFDPANSKTYDASCHCGNIRISADVSPPLPPSGDHEVVACNCIRRVHSYKGIPPDSLPGSICIRGADWHIYLPTSCVRYTKGEDHLKVRRPAKISRTPP